MKYLLLACTLLLAANAFASKPDSGICPWKMPFTINIHGVGNSVSSERSLTITNGSVTQSSSNSDAPIPATYDFKIVVDTTSSFLSDSTRYSLDADTLYYWTMRPLQSDSTVTVYTLLSIAFAKAHDSILSLSISVSDTTGIVQEGSFVLDNLNFQINSLIFDDNSIYSSDSSLKKHNIFFSQGHTQATHDHIYYERQDETIDYYYTTGDGFTATSVTLSGLFRTTTFSDPSASVAPPLPNSLSLFNSNGSIACSFEESERERNLEIYSPLGMKVASVTIPAGENQASLPHLAAGIYFVRLEGDVRKIYIP